MMNLSFTGYVRRTVLGAGTVVLCCIVFAVLFTVLFLLFFSRGGWEPYFQIVALMGGTALCAIGAPVAISIWLIRRRRQYEAWSWTALGVGWLLLLLVCNGSVLLTSYLASVVLEAYDRSIAKEWAEMEIARVRAYFEIHGRYPTEAEFIDEFSSPPFPWSHESVLYRQSEAGFSFDIVTTITGGEIWGSSTGKWVGYD